MVIKKGPIMLALLIPCKYKVCNMDVYLAPLVEELQLLWEGVWMVDMSRSEAVDANVDAKFEANVDAKLTQLCHNLDT
jgi:hypothetical protein